MAPIKKKANTNDENSCDVITHFLKTVITKKNRNSCFPFFMKNTLLQLPK